VAAAPLPLLQEGVMAQHQHQLPPAAKEEAVAEAATSWAAREEAATVVPRLLRHRLPPAAEAATGAD
jgi:hypothetical protein